ncbi:DUF2911 domain-containing protein [Jiulongibacter sp. NS-SX5]|uniref:DUF2911 domain-containing protein n=1 Tax=Jiulongibacter sp. NS-SX5 TaxID=3463854 RepID=UPI00405976C7
MKKVLVLLLTALSFQLAAQDFAGIDKSIMDLAYYPNGAHRAGFSKTADEKGALMPRIKVIYSRPLVNGRTIFGDLIKYNEDWRFGANESTEITFYTNVKIGETILAPGRYTLFCTPTESAWTLHVHPRLDGWGNYGYDTSKTLASVSAPVQKSDKLIEAFSITFYEGSPGVAHLKAGWENSIVEFPIEIL